MMKYIVKILQKINKTPLVLLHAARLMTRPTGVGPAVDLSWKALLYALLVTCVGKVNYNQCLFVFVLLADPEACITRKQK